MGHNPTLLTLTVMVPLAFIVVAVFNGLAGGGIDTGLYQSNTGDISDKYYLEITPAGWTFSIWGFIYTWQALWIIYAVVALFRKSDQGPHYTNPILLPVPFLLSYLLNMALNCTWMVVFDREYIAAAAAVLFLMTVTLYICMFFSYRNLDKGIDTLIKQERKSDVWLTRFLVQNGLGIYATWCTIATLLNFAMLLTYESTVDIDQRDACTVSLSILAAVVLAFLVADWFFTDRWTRYTFTPYLVLVVAFTGSIVKNYDEGARNTIFTIVLLAIAAVALLVKLVLLFARHCRKTSDGVRITETSGVKV
ncbi:hypothetical protein MAR_019736 [Mya arenaria]|uniref:Uncharacterized protein n=1 Tax=Mya arenaria TaxID=6604 RepID=A0ABY7E5X1_MYAAR|nr:uncharacterized protein LOC128234771 [Mya arenaria]XP_052805233.1 uncharacterized protein LOC128234771 [Mya arenaria]WAR04367.1 hypothetical protein MAR_019736 [Mya arenaria]